MELFVPVSPLGGQLAQVPRLARQAEQAGFGVSVIESTADPMQQLTLAAGSTTAVTLMSNVVIAFARSPMTLALQATAIQEYSHGRLMLGLGSQIKPHIERRFSMPWSAPAARMEEYIQGLRAIWESWATGKPLNFRGRFYDLTLMIPEFTPAIEQPPPRVLVAAVGQLMTAVAGRVADGVIIHPFATPRYLREVTLPALRNAAEEASRSGDGFDVVGAPFVISGQTPEDIARSRELVRARVAFYGSTPAYQPVLALHGWPDLGAELHALSRTTDPQRWERMTELVDDTVLCEFAVEGTAEAVARQVLDRYDGIFTHLSVNSSGLPDPAALYTVMAAVASARSSRLSAGTRRVEWR